MTWGFGRAAFSLANPFGLNQAYSSSVEFFMLVHFGSKYLDFGDSVFMVLKQNYRQLSFLHLFHHSSILVVWGFLLQARPPPSLASYASSLTHSLSPVGSRQRHRLLWSGH